MNAMLDSQSRSEDETSSNSQGDLEALDALFLRYRRALSLVAYRILGNHEEAEDAVQNSLRAVSDNVPRFENEGAFRSWLVRVLIDEAVILLHKQKCASLLRAHHKNGFYREQ
jgi:RNA polymerase sigma-70 factor (ECF subfamily)